MNQFSIYKTVQGDTFDIIALKFYNDEFKSIEIIKANPDHTAVLKFDEGVILKIPKLEDETSNDLPPWKR